MKTKLNSAQQVADFLGIKVDTLYHYARSGRIRAMKIGKAWKFSDDDLRSFLNSQRHFSTDSRTSGLPEVLGNAPTLVIGSERISSHGTSVSYSQINLLADRLSDRLHIHGIGPGDRIIVLMENSVEAVISCFAAWKLGAVLLTEDPAMKCQGMEQILRDLAPSALILDFAVWESLIGAEHELRAIKAVLIKGCGFMHSIPVNSNVESLDAVFQTHADSADYGENPVPTRDVAPAAC